MNAFAHPSRRRQEVRTFATTTRSLLELADWLHGLGVTLVVMESTSTDWKPPFYLLEESCACWLVNAREAKHVPGPAQDRQAGRRLAGQAGRAGDAAAQLGAAAVATGELRDLTRYRRTLIHERTREKQRAEKLLEDTQIKLSTVVSDMFGVSGRQMLEALTAGQRDPKVLAQLAQGRMRSKLGALAEALTGHFRAHHGYLLRMMLDRIDALGAQADQLTAGSRSCSPRLPIRWSSWMSSPAWAGSARRAHRRDRRVDVPLSQRRSPGVVGQVRAHDQSLGRQDQVQLHRQGQPWIGATIGEAAMGASKTKTFLGSRYRRIVKRRGKQRALVAVGNQVLTIAYYLLSNPHARFADLGADFHDRVHPQRRTRQLIRELEHLSGKKVTLHTAA